VADLYDFDKLPKTPPNRGGKTPFNVDTILTRPDPNKVVEKIKYIIPDMAAPGDVILIMGPQKDGKTFLSVRIACECSVGGDLLDGFAAIEAKKVLYLMFDNFGEARFFGRIKKAGWAYNPDNIRFVFNENVRREGFNMDLDTRDSILEKLTDAWKPDILFIDTLGAAHSKDENRNNEMKPIIEKVTRIARDLNASVFIVHHSRKRKAGDAALPMTQDDSVGASIILRMASSVIGVKKVIGEDQKEVHSVKNLGSWHKEFQPFEFRLIDETDALGRTWVRMPINLKAAVDKTSQDAVMRVVSANYWDGESFTRQDIIKRSNLGQVTVSTVLNRLVESGFLVCDGVTKNKRFAIRNKKPL
jgi:hypothetical protein